MPGALDLAQEEANGWRSLAVDFELRLTSAYARLREIASIIEAVDNRCMASDGFVAPTLREMTADEMRRIYSLAKG